MAPSPRPKFTMPASVMGDPNPLREAVGALLMVAGIVAYFLHQDLTAASAHFLAGSAVYGVPLALPGART